MTHDNLNDMYTAFMRIKKTNTETELQAHHITPGTGKEGKKNDETRKH